MTQPCATRRGWESFLSFDLRQNGLALFCYARAKLKIGQRALSGPDTIDKIPKLFPQRFPSRNLRDFRLGRTMTIDAQFIGLETVIEDC